MRLSHDYKIIYYSIPKTGSETVRSFLDPVSDEGIVKFPEVDDTMPFYRYMRPFAVRKIFLGKGWNFDGYYKFATVRNPWARLASLYNMTRRNWGGQWDVSFSEWIKSLDPTGRSTSNMSEKWYAHGTMSMVKFLSDQNGNILVDTVFGLRIKPRPFTPIPKRAWVWIAFNAD